MQEHRKVMQSLYGLGKAKVKQLILLQILLEALWLKLMVSVLIDDIDHIIDQRKL